MAHSSPVACVSFSCSAFEGVENVDNRRLRFGGKFVGVVANGDKRLKLGLLSIALCITVSRKPDRHRLIYYLVLSDISYLLHII